MTRLALENAPSELSELLANTRDTIDRELERRLFVPADDPGQLAAAMRYAATSPGKRLRPALAIATCEACGGTRADVLPAAIAIELLHAYTLVHDDLPAMDDDDLRRGRPTVHVVFGEAIAILAGDGLLTLAFETIAELGARAPAAVAVLARRAGWRELLAGQALDLTLAGASAPFATIERLHAAKTGALFAAACELGAIAAGADTNAREALARYGCALGIAFQHADDLDDGELPEHAAAASQRSAELGREALAIAQSFGDPAHMLARFARWFGAAA